MTAVHQMAQVRDQALRILSESLNDRDRTIQQLTDRIAELEAENVRLRRNLAAADDLAEWHAGGVR